MSCVLRMDDGTGSLMCISEFHEMFDADARQG